MELVTFFLAAKIFGAGVATGFTLAIALLFLCIYLDALKR